MPSTGRLRFGGHHRTSGGRALPTVAPLLLQQPFQGGPV